MRSWLPFIVIIALVIVGGGTVSGWRVRLEGQPVGGSDEPGERRGEVVRPRPGSLDAEPEPALSAGEPGSDVGSSCRVLRGSYRAAACTSRGAASSVAPATTPTGATGKAPRWPIGRQRGEIAEALARSLEPDRCRARRDWLRHC
jgi:hypothetical protein